MKGSEAICASCGSTGNPHGDPPPAHARSLIVNALSAARTGAGRVLLICPPSVPRAYVFRVMRESHRATDAEMARITYAMPASLPPEQRFKFAFVAPDMDPVVKAYVEEVLERPPGPSVWDRIRSPVI